MVYFMLQQRTDGFGTEAGHTWSRFHEAYLMLRNYLVGYVCINCYVHLLTKSHHLLRQLS